MNRRNKQRGLVAAMALLALARLQAADQGVFGEKQAGTNGLIGIIYDLKQTQKNQPSGVDPANYFAVVREFLTKGWDEAVLNRYFRAASPLYTTQIFIPEMGAGAAPKAFGMEGVIKPSVWVLHYKGQVTPPEDGVYRFLCFSDDFMTVGVNGKTVCEGSLGLSFWKSSEKKRGPKTGNNSLAYGDWVEMKKDQPIDLDVLVGERPGGVFYAFLLYERKGVEYPVVDGQTLYPIFQMATYDTPAAPPGKGPLFLKSPELWQGVP
jgi:hypothetical protein